MPSVSLPLLQTHLERSLGPDLLSNDYRSSWTPDNPLAGLCSVATEAAWFILGGPLSDWVPFVVRDGHAGTHWWLQNAATGERYDPTASQYYNQRKVPPYERGLEGKGSGFMGIRQDPGNAWGFDRKPSLRAARLIDRMLAAAGGPSPVDFLAQLQVVEVAPAVSAGRRFRPK